MNGLLLSLILCSVSMSAVAQIVLKKGMSSSSIQSALSAGKPLLITLKIAANPWVFGGLSLYFLGAVVWLFVLSRVEVSLAYPFVGLGFILTMLLGWLLMGENLTCTRLVGTLFVASGVVLIART